MDFRTNTHKLIARICQYCREQRLPAPGQVRTTKLVYLIECDYYGWERKRLTDLDWIFWHYGPWSPTLHKVLKDEFKAPEETETEPGKFVAVHWQPPQFESPKLKFDNPTIEGVLLGVLEKFAMMPYSELLDYVYFETWPMKNVTKGHALDFGSIPKPHRYVDPVSLLPPKSFYELRKRFQQLEVASSIELAEEGEADSELLDLLAKIDSEGTFTPPKGDVIMSERAESELGHFFED